MSRSTIALVLSSLLLAAGSVVGSASCAGAGESAPAVTAAPAPDHRLDWWREARFGMFLHWGLYAIPAGRWGEDTGHAEWIRTTAHIPRARYEELLAEFDPVRYDPDAWVRMAKDAGMKYIVITSKHHDGFGLFDSAQTDWDVMSTPWGKDLLAPLAEACRRHGLRICWYHSIMDWHHPDYLPRRDWEDWSAEGANFDRFVAYLHAQVTELLTNYGDIGVLWFDGEWESTWNHGYGQPLYDLCRKLQPNVIVNNRVDVGRGGMAGMSDAGYAGDFGTPEQEIPATGIPGVDWETCMTMNDHWGYNAADTHWKSTEELIRMLIDIASKGGNFLLNVGPRADGTFPPEAVERLAGMGEWMDVHGEAIHGTQAGLFESLPWGRSTTRAGADGTTIYLFVFDWPAGDVLAVPGLGTAPERARILAPGDDPRVDSRPIEGGLEVRLDPRRRDLIATVVALEYEGTPVVYRTPRIEAAAELFVRPLTVTLGPETAGVELRFTIDGSAPEISSRLYTGPLTLVDSARLAVRAFHRGRPVSAVVAREFTRATPRPAASDVEGREHGLHLAAWQGTYGALPALGERPPDRTAEVASLDLGPPVEHEVRAYTGFLRVAADDAYVFHLTSDDGARLFVDGELVVDNDGLHGPLTRTGAAPLAAGWHRLRVEWFNKTGGAVLDLQVGPAGAPPAPIAAADLARR
ncbi:MAG: alpha-L-fucosidase [Planctomycetota bacterium]